MDAAGVGERPLWSHGDPAVVRRGITAARSLRLQFEPICWVSWV